MKILKVLACLVAVLALGSPSGAAAADPQAGAQPAAKTERAKKEKKPKKAKKAKTKPDNPAPDEGPAGTDTDAAPAPAPADQIETDGKGTRVSWKQHPSFRIGSVFRIDLEAKFQEDVRDTYVGEPDLPRAELHRNRIGVQGHLFKQIE